MHLLNLRDAQDSEEEEEEVIQQYRCEAEWKPVGRFLGFLLSPVEKSMLKNDGHHSSQSDDPSHDN